MGGCVLFELCSVIEGFQVALKCRGSLHVGWDMTDHRKRGAPSGSVNFVFVSCGTVVHLKRHEQIRNIFCGTSVCCCCCLKKNLNAPRPSEHPPVRGKKCQNVQVGSIAENTKPLHGI